MGCHRDAQVKHLDHKQATAFHLLATQEAVHSAWLAPPSLVELKQKDYLGFKDLRLICDYWEVHKEEAIMLDVMLQQCAIWAGAPPDTFCGAVQEQVGCSTSWPDSSHAKNNCFYCIYVNNMHMIPVICKYLL